jgi:hypothetical protein
MLPTDGWIRHSQNPLLSPEQAFEKGRFNSPAPFNYHEANMSLAEIQA